MTGHPHRLVAGFNGRRVEIDCDSARLAAQVRLRLMHLLAAPADGAPAALRLTLSEPAESFVELRDSAGRYVAGSPEHVLYFVRKWMTADFAAAHPQLIWLHAGAAAARDGAVVLLAGPAGAGKSTLVVRLVERGWCLFGDDVVPVDRQSTGGAASPVHPGCPDDAVGRSRRPAGVRRAAEADGGSTGQIASHGSRAQSARLSFRRTIAIEALDRRWRRCRSYRPPRRWPRAFSYPTSDTRGLVAGVFRLAQRVPCYRLDYRDATAAAAVLARPFRPERFSV